MCVVIVVIETQRNEPGAMEKLELNTKAITVHRGKLRTRELVLLFRVGFQSFMA